jgi:hypothetical protein
MNLETIQPALMGMPIWLLFHMGKMEKAVLTKAGGVNTPCGVVAAAKDNENCNRDSLFVQSLGHYDATGAMFFDDFTQFSKAGQGSLWAFRPRINRHF